MDLNIRNVPDEIAVKLKIAAAENKMTLREYLVRMFAQVIGYKLRDGELKPK